MMNPLRVPEVDITNRVPHKYELISLTRTIFKTGEVLVVQRAVQICFERYELEEYPFDTQKLTIKVASTKYMAADIVLQEDERLGSGVADDIMYQQPFVLDGVRLYHFEETDGALVKSRGVLEVSVKRTLVKYGESHLMPAALLLMISWGVFWFPFQGPFITPRLAMGVLSLMSFTQLMIASEDKLPDGASCNWNDIFNQEIQTMMFCTIVLNILAEICKNQLKLEARANVINSQAKWLLPGLSILTIAIALASGYYHLLRISFARVLTKVVTGVILALYLGNNFKNVYAEMAANQFQEREKQAKDDKDNARGKQAQEEMIELAQLARKSHAGTGMTFAISPELAGVGSSVQMPLDSH